MIIGGLWLVMAVLLFLGKTLVENQWNKSQMILKRAQSDYQGMSAELAMSYRMKFKTKMVGGILEDRFEYGQTFDKVNKLFRSDEMKVDKIDLEGKKGVRVTGRGLSLAAADTLEGRIEKINQGGITGISKAKLEELKFDNGSWNFTVEVVF
jgi:hypothetical protein